MWSKWLINTETNINLTNNININCEIKCNSNNIQNKFDKNDEYLNDLCKHFFKKLKENGKVYNYINSFNKMIDDMNRYNINDFNKYKKTNTLYLWNFQT